MRILTVACVIAFVSVASCKSAEDEKREREAIKAEVLAEVQRAEQEKAEQARRAAEEAARIAEEKKLAAKRDVVENPEKYLETSEINYFDKGFINDYRQVNQVTVMNKSDYALRDLKANVEWYTADKTLLGSTPMVLKGSIPAGGTRKFAIADGTMTSGTIQGSGRKAVIKWSNVEVVEPKQ